MSLSSHLIRSDAYINGEWVAGSKQFDVRNPATGDVIGHMADLGADETRSAIEAAEKAMKPWAALTGKERGQALMRWFDLIVENADELATIMVAEQGKPFAEARGEVLYGASFVQWFAEEAKRTYGDIIPNTVPGTRIAVIRQPIGVCAAITPWNFPSAMITRKVAPPLAAGCSVIVKPPEETPFSAIALAVLAEKAGLPAGLFNVITTSTSRVVGQELCDNPTVRKLSFTGSTEVGKVLMAQCAGTLKKLSLELGGNAPFIVFEDADIDAAVEGALICKYRNAGQTCVCANRIYVHENIYDEFAERFSARVSALKVGKGDEDGTDVGPLINKEGVDKVVEHLEDAKEKGGDIIAGGNPHSAGDLFFEPTVIKNAAPDMKFAREETFGPLAPLFKFKDEDEVIRLANDTNYGLAAYFYARDMGRVWRVAEALEYGMVGVNSPILSTEVAPFGGIKESGVGREGSRYGMDDFMEMKYILMGGV